ncbi:MAG: hypothetical protein PUB98_01945 [Clostridiales bacterium]|nr:hypothetical protein [Clostridiales bacterium]
MDKYEYKVKLDQIKALTAEGNYAAAAQIADTIHWNKIKNVNALVKAGEVYEMTERYEESKELLLMAYDRSPIGRTIVYRLTEVAVKMGNYDEAQDYYQEFVEIAPHDSLKYVLKYKINKAQGADVTILAEILEELKEQEYSEEWAYELAYLYHKAGMSEKCIETCDELILWFGDGPYVERALELKMLYQPLTKQQEEKYRQFHLNREGIVEVRPEETLESGEIVKEIKQIPNVEVSAARFNTQNLQKELEKSMLKIMEATEKETVDDSMENIKRLVEEIPYLQLAREDTTEDKAEIMPHIETDAEIDNSLKDSFQELLAEDYDGQLRLYVPEQKQYEPQVRGQMSIEEVLSEWEKTKRAAEAALQEAEQRKLQSAKARALQEAEEIMGRLADVIPKLDSGLTPKELLEEEYLAGQPIADDRAAEMVANMNLILQQEIDRLSDENARMDEQLAAAGAFPDSDKLMDQQLEEALVPEITALLSEEALQISEPGEQGRQEQPEEVFVPEITALLSEEALQISEPGEQSIQESGVSTEQVTQELLEIRAWKELAGQATQELPQMAAAQEEVEKKDAEVLPKISITESESMEDMHALESEGQEKPTEHPIAELSEEQRELFTYFAQISGMEKQICRTLEGVEKKLTGNQKISVGNIVIQGDANSGKTTLATNIVKCLQKETGRPSGRIGRIEAGALNHKDVAEMLDKVAGGCLIIEKAGEISKETAARLSRLLENDKSGLLVILEDSKKGIDKAFGKDAGFAARFSEKITIPTFTADELVEFAQVYARDQGYTIDEMGILAVHNSISSIQKVDQATTPVEVKEIVDRAIARAEKGGLKKMFSIITSRRYDKDSYIILHEKDFD